MPKKTRKEAPSVTYKRWLRGVEMFMTPEHDALIGGIRVQDHGMNDLEALAELVLGYDPRRSAPSGYFMRPGARKS